MSVLSAGCSLLPFLSVMYNNIPAIKFRFPEGVTFARVLLANVKLDGLQLKYSIQTYSYLNKIIHELCTFGIKHNTQSLKNVTIIQYSIMIV